MAREPKVDRVKFQRDTGAYFRSTPNASFLTFDDGSLQLEPPESYADYTDVSGVDTLVVKVGTSIITHKDYRRTIYNMKCVAEDLTQARENGLDVLLVTSGAVGLGRKVRLRVEDKIPEGEKDAPEQKRLDAIAGQPLLYTLWQHHFHPQPVRESLVTHYDFEDKSRSDGLLSRYAVWLSKGEIPVVNEDDAKSLEEIETVLKGERVFSDNDGLAGLIAQLLKSEDRNPMLILLSNTDGIYTSESVAAGQYTPIRIVKGTAKLEEQASEISSSRGRGGVIAKIEAARNAASAGIPVVVANGQYCNHDAPFQERREASQRKYNVLNSILSGEVVGTRFLAHQG